MPNYKPYGTVKSTPNRRARKGSRRSTFTANATMARVARKAARLERKAAREAAEETVE